MPQLTARRPKKLHTSVGPRTLKLGALEGSALYQQMLDKKITKLAAAQRNAPKLKQNLAIRNSEFDVLYAKLKKDGVIAVHKTQARVVVRPERSKKTAAARFRGRDVSEESIPSEQKIANTIERIHSQLDKAQGDESIARLKDQLQQQNDLKKLHKLRREIGTIYNTMVKDRERLQKYHSDFIEAQRDPSQFAAKASYSQASSAQAYIRAMSYQNKQIQREETRQALRAKLATRKRSLKTK